MAANRDFIAWMRNNAAALLVAAAQLREAREALERIAKHTCDTIYGEYSGRHDPDCRRCIARAALASLEPAKEQP